MIDYGLLASLIVAFGVPAMLARHRPVATFDPPIGFLDAVLGPAAVGLIVGRLVTLALDDPRSVGRLADMLVIRSGVEFWPGVAAGMLALGVAARFQRVTPSARLAALAPLSLVAYSGYEGTCLVRDGCFGPASPIGLRPSGLSATMLPIGMLVAAVVVGAAAVIGGRLLAGAPPTAVVLAAVAAVALARSVASFWLPHIGDGLTRQHQSSLIVAAVTVPLTFLLVAVGLRQDQQEVAV